MSDGVVVPLFVSEQDLEAAWQRYDAAMLAVHAMYQGGEEDETVRLAAVEEAMEAEAAFRTAFARTTPRRVAG